MPFIINKINFQKLLLKIISKLKPVFPESFFIGLANNIVHPSYPLIYRTKYILLFQLIIFYWKQCLLDYFTQKKRTKNLGLLKKMPGWLSDLEALFLFYLAYLSGRKIKGDIVEIGSFMGKSTIPLSLGCQYSGSGRVYAIDPFDGSCDNRGLDLSHEIQYKRERERVAREPKSIRFILAIYN